MTSVISHTTVDSRDVMPDDFTPHDPQDPELAEKQALLEREGLVARCRSLIDLLEMKAILTSRCQSSSFRH